MDDLLGGGILPQPVPDAVPTIPMSTDLLGFAIERSELDVTDKVVEKYWLRGIQ